MATKSGLKLGEYVALRAGVDAQIYTLDKVEGFTAYLSYKRGTGRAKTDIDIGLVRKASPEQLARAEKAGEL